MSESTRVTVGLAVHARSIRLAAVCADELLEERTLAYDEEQLERLLRRWPAVRCCYEAGPTGFGLYRRLVEGGIECAVVAPGLVPQRPGERVKTDPRDARKLARLHAGGLLEPIYVPSPELEAARDLVRAREDARLDRMRDRQRLSKFCLRHGRLLPTSAWTVSRRTWLGQSVSSTPPSSSPSTLTCTPSTSSTIASTRWRRRSARPQSRARGVSWWRDCAACVASTPTPRWRWPSRSATSAASAAPSSSWPSSASCPRSAPRASSARSARSPRSATHTSAGCWSNPPGTPAGGQPSATSSRAANAARTPP